MHIDFHLEEPSAEEALRNIVPRILTTDHTYRFLIYNGKHDLLKKLPNRLKTYSKWLSDNYKLVVLIDEDRQGCFDLKQRLEETAANAGLTTKTMASGKQQSFHVLNRIVVEELEAWFFGDTEALRKAYPNVSERLLLRPRFSDPDAIQGGTWETLERVLQNAGYYRSGLPKIRTARNISKYMVPERNTSRSFQTFRTGLLAL
ncbi:MAG: DUF4276 family protein [bacterium]